jgi:hypothetical protein
MYIYIHIPPRFWSAAGSNIGHSGRGFWEDRKAIHALLMGMSQNGYSLLVFLALFL